MVGGGDWVAAHVKGCLEKIGPAVVGTTIKQQQPVLTPAKTAILQRADIKKDMLADHFGPWIYFLW